MKPIIAIVGRPNVGNLLSLIDSLGGREPSFGMSQA